MKKICYIFGACLLDPPIEINKKHGDLVITADGGYNLIKDKSLIDTLLGDFDSIEEIPKCDNTIKYPVEKDDTDLFLAYKTAHSLGYKNFVIYGGLGGRIDHTLANIQMLVSMAENGCQGYLVNNEVVITALSNSSITLAPRNSGIVSVFCMGDSAEGVDLTGLKFELKDKTLTKDYPLGVSNEFIGKNAKISVRKGTLIVVWYDNNPNIDELFTF